MTETRKKRTKEVDMCNGPLLSKIIVFFIPVMLSNMLQMLYNAADQAVVGQFAGSDALGAVGSTTALTNLIVCIVMGLSVGSSSVVARMYGADNKAAVSRAVHTSMLIGVIGGFIIGILGMFLARPLLVLMGTQADVLDDAVLYMRITFAGLPVVSVYNFGSAVLRAIGDTKRPMFFLIIAGFINVALNLFFVIVFDMSVDGVALATIISQAVSGALTVRWLMKAEGCYKLEIKKLRLHKSECIQIIKIGVPASLQSSMFSLSNIIIQSGINSISKDAVSGCAAAGTIENLIYQAVNALYHTSLSFCGQNYGAKKYGRIMKSFVYCLVIVSIVGLSIGALVYIFDEFFLGIFLGDSPAAVEYGKERLRMTCLWYFLCGLMEVGCGALRSINHAVPSLINSIMGACVFRIVWIYTYFKIYGTVTALFLSYPISWALTTVLHAAMFLYYFATMKKRDELCSAK